MKKTPDGRDEPPDQVQLTTSQQRYKLTIADNGIGLPLKISLSMFEPYVPDNAPKGLGLGLVSIVKKISLKNPAGNTIALENAPVFAG